jgi:ABC-type glycerol-3-phosphate transport system permease component
MGFWPQVHLFVARLALARFVSMYLDRILRKYRKVLLWVVLLASYLLPSDLVMLVVFKFLAYLGLVRNLHGKAHKCSQTDNY